MRAVPWHPWKQPRQPARQGVLIRSSNWSIEDELWRNPATSWYMDIYGIEAYVVNVFCYVLVFEHRIICKLSHVSTGAGILPDVTCDHMWPMIYIMIYVTRFVVWFFCYLKKQNSGNKETIWVFPKIVVPPNHPFLLGFSILNHPFWGITIFGNTHHFVGFSFAKGRQSCSRCTDLSDFRGWFRAWLWGCAFVGSGIQCCPIFVDNVLLLWFSKNFCR